MDNLGVEKARGDSYKTDVERIADYLKQAARYRKWAECETVPAARDSLLDMAQHYERLAVELEASTRRLRC